MHRNSVPKIIDFDSTYHFNDLNFSSDSQMVEEHFQVLLHLNGIVLHLSNGKDAHFAVFPCAVLFQEEWQQHQKTAIMYNPPNVNVSANLQLIGALLSCCPSTKSKRTFSVESGKKLIPFGITNAIRDDVTTRHVSKNVFHVRSVSLCRHP